MTDEMWEAFEEETDPGTPEMDLSVYKAEDLKDPSDCGDAKW